jgi:hypothetical protein
VRTKLNAALAPNAPVAIVVIDKCAGGVTLCNVRTTTANLDGWTMCSMRGAQIHPSIGETLALDETRDVPPPVPSMSHRHLKACRSPEEPQVWIRHNQWFP